MVRPRGFCAGVVRAIDTVVRVLEQSGPPVYVRRAIVHNQHVVAELASKGAIFVDELDEVPMGGIVVFSAHGVSRRVERQAVQRELRAIDATCPLVAKVHREVENFVAEGYQVVLIGHAGHDEVEGTLGRANSVRLVSSLADVERLDFGDGDRIACVTQTTLIPGEIETIVMALRARFPRLVLPASDDVCYATRNRQVGVRWLAERSDVVLVFGDRTSSNAHRLREVAADGCRAFLLGSIADLDPAWLIDVEIVGITAAASTPESIVRDAADYFAERGATVSDELIELESIRFALPVLLP